MALVHCVVHARVSMTILICVAARIVGVYVRLSPSPHPKNTPAAWNCALSRPERLAAPLAKPGFYFGHNDQRPSLCDRIWPHRMALPASEHAIVLGALSLVPDRGLYGTLKLG
jgi:hypothetical protein